MAVEAVLHMSLFCMVPTYIHHWHNIILTSGKNAGLWGWKPNWYTIKGENAISTASHHSSNCRYVGAHYQQCSPAAWNMIIHVQKCRGISLPSSHTVGPAKDMHLCIFALNSIFLKWCSNTSRVSMAMFNMLTKWQLLLCYLYNGAPTKDVYLQ